MATRYNVSCNTGPGSDKDASGNYYDQMIGISQSIINASFRDLFQTVEGIGEMYHDDRLLGQLDGELDAPTIIIDGSSDKAPEILYQLRIKSGNATFNDGEMRSMNNWVLSVRTLLNEIPLEDLPGDPPQLRARKKEWREDISNSFHGFRPQDYRVQRIFAGLGSAAWQTPDEVLSTCWDEKTRTTIHFKDWAAKPENSRYATPLLLLIANWAKKQETDKKSTMAIRFKLPEEKIANNNPTFRTYTLLSASEQITHPYNGSLHCIDRHLETHANHQIGPVYTHSQAYPFVNSDGIADRQSVGDYNCLLYCENLDTASPEQRSSGKVVLRQLPANRNISHNGNLAEPGLNDRPEIYGSFVMDHRAFLTSFLLPQLQELCLSTYIQIGKPSYERVAADGAKVFGSKYAIGTELEGNTARSASDEFFRFQRKDSSASEDSFSYEWSKSSQDSDFGKATPYTRAGDPTSIQGYSTHKIEAISSVRVVGKSGDSALKVAGKVVYSFWLRFADDEGMTWNENVKKYACTATWSIRIALDDPTDGVMVLRVADIDSTNTPLDLSTSVSIERIDSGAVGNVQEEIKSGLQESLKRGIDVITKNIKNRFNHAGSFIYPGHGELGFKDPKFTRLGGIIAKAEYQRPTGPDGMMSFPKADRMPTILVQPSTPAPMIKKFGGS